MAIRSQLLKGVLPACILAVIDRQPVYGYELAQKLEESGLPEISDGTIYPILLRLQKQKLVYSEMRPSESGGPKRKYYFLTAEGKNELLQMRAEWGAIANPVSTMLKEDPSNV